MKFQYLGAGAAGAGFFASFGLGWKNLKTLRAAELAANPPAQKLEEKV